MCAKYFEVHHLKQGYNIHSAIVKETKRIKRSQVESNFNSKSSRECLGFRIIFVCKGISCHSRYRTVLILVDTFCVPLGLVTSAKGHWRILWLFINLSSRCLCTSV